VITIKQPSKRSIYFGILIFLILTAGIIVILFTMGGGGESVIANAKFV